jgi:hypothetical protein
VSIVVGFGGRLGEVVCALSAGVNGPPGKLIRKMIIFVKMNNLYHHFFYVLFSSSLFLLLCILFISMQWSYAQQTKANPSAAEQEIIDLSKQKWIWMADKKADELAALFHEKSMFVHMGGSWGKEREIDVIRSGGIHYKKAEVYSVEVNIFDNTAILLNDIDLLAVVGGNEVTNPFMVTEVYINENGKWRMGSLTFSRLSRPVKMK